MFLFQTTQKVAFGKNIVVDIDEPSKLKSYQTSAINVVKSEVEKGNVTPQEGKEKIKQIEQTKTVQDVENLMKKWGYFELYQKELQRQQELSRLRKDQASGKQDASTLTSADVRGRENTSKIQDNQEFASEQSEKHKKDNYFTGGKYNT